MFLEKITLVTGKAASTHQRKKYMELVMINNMNTSHRAGGQYKYKGYGAGDDYNTHLMELVIIIDKKDMELVEITTHLWSWW